MEMNWSVNGKQHKVVLSLHVCVNHQTTIITRVLGATIKQLSHGDKEQMRTFTCGIIILA